MLPNPVLLHEHKELIMADEKYEVEVEKDVQDTGQDEKDIEVYDDPFNILVLF